MKPGPVLENLVAAVAESCRAGLDPGALRAEVLPRLRRAVPIDALWWATVDPSTLLFTQAYREEIPEETGPYFVENEFLHDDVNKWTELARHTVPVRTLLQATGGQAVTSTRYQDIFRPLGLEDELRAVLRAQGVSWGFMCLHREEGSSFSREEVAFVGRLAPHLAEGIRLGVLMRSAAINPRADAPGLIVLAADGSLISTNAAAQLWLDELNPTSVPDELPIEVLAVAGKLRRLGASTVGVPRLRVLTRAGRWVTLHGSWLPNDAAGANVAVIIEPSQPSEVAPLVMSAYGLTARERAITELVCQGFSTREIARRLHISVNTVQDHLKPVFEKTGVRSRRELVATILRQDDLPLAKNGAPIGPTGSFV
jgi:DNA-binding CsgD family transcriptional regulator